MLVASDLAGVFIFPVIAYDMDHDLSSAAPKLELVTDKLSYVPGETARLWLSAAEPRAQIIVIPRHIDDAAQRDVHIIPGSGGFVDLALRAKDAPHTFVEAFVVYGGQCHRERKQILIPPQDRLLPLTVNIDKEVYAPGENVALEIHSSAAQPEDISLAVVVYDRSLEYIAGGNLTPPFIHNYGPINDIYAAIFIIHLRRISYCAFNVKTTIYFSRSDSDRSSMITACRVLCA